MTGANYSHGAGTAVLAGQIAAGATVINIKAITANSPNVVTDVAFDETGNPTLYVTGTYYTD